ncbi:MAG: glycosyltransferase family 4 protein [Thermoplasmatota archaeon]
MLAYRRAQGTPIAPSGWSICFSTQTPPVQFLSERGQRAPPNTVRDLREVLVENVDFRYSPGGVTRMVLPLLQHLREEGALRESHWVSLNPRAPPETRLSDTILHHITLGPRRMTGYGTAKETIWGAVHGTAENESAGDLFWSDPFSEYAYYNRLVAEKIRTLDERHDFDLLYIHDFQQLAVGQMLGGVKPKILRWHIPFEPDSLPSDWDTALTAYVGAYDTVVVSARRYVSAAQKFARRVEVSYPYVDPREFSRSDSAEIERTCSKFRIRPTDEVILVVARMDPMKGQDLAIGAFALLAPHRPNARLVIVGNGSFSSSGQGGLLSKGSQWKGRLETQVRDLGIGDRVTFTGHVIQTELDALYERCAFTLLPSIREGFGLVVVESWLHGKPTIVTKHAGVTEIMTDGRSGYIVDPRDVVALADKMEGLLDDDDMRQTLSLGGQAVAPLCTIDRALAREEQLIANHVERP